MTIKSGCYALVHVPSGAAYIGSAVNIVSRFTHHRHMLRKNKHANKKLQFLWNNSLEGYWVFCQLLPPASVRLLLKQEQYWIENWPGEILNIHPRAGTATGHRLSNATKQKMSEAAIRVAASPAERARRSARAKAQHATGNLGKKHAGHRRQA